MKSKRIYFMLSIIIFVFCGFALMACNFLLPNKKVLLNVCYTATEGGHIDGISNQVVVKGENAETVVAVPDKNYAFVKWSDENYEATRTDLNINEEINVTAIFEKEIYHLKYVASEGGRVEATEGGYVDGAVDQYLTADKYGVAVTAVPYDEYVFVKWSDDYKLASRADKISEPTTIIAYFEKVGKKFDYIYNNATENCDDSSILIKYDEINNAKLVVPNRTNSIFEGWYLDKEFSKKVSDEQGNILLNDSLFLEESNKFYAKFSIINEVRYKILMVYITKINLEIPDDSIILNYTMTDSQIQTCKELSKRFELYLNDLFAGWVKFEVDSFFTNKAIGIDDFKKDPHLDKPYFITAPEVDISDIENHNLIFNMLPISLLQFFESGAATHIDLKPPLDANWIDKSYKYQTKAFLNLILNDKSNIDNYNYEDEIYNIISDGGFCEAINNQRQYTIEPSLKHDNYNHYLRDLDKYMSYYHSSISYHKKRADNYLTGHNIPYDNVPPQILDKNNPGTAVPYEFWQYMQSTIT